MKRSIVCLAASACLVALLGAGEPAHAAALSYVSGSGADVNDCLTPTTACRQISAAIAKTDALGVVQVLSGVYDGFTVNKSIDIVAERGGATVIAGGSPLITIVDPADRVVIHGLTLNAFSGVSVSNTTSVHLTLEDCGIVYGGLANAYGIDFQPTGGLSNLVLTRVSVDGGDFTAASNAVRIRPGGAGGVNAVFESVQINRPAAGLIVDGRSSTGSNSVTIRNSTISGIASFGLTAIDSGGGATNVSVENSSIVNNAQQGIIANGANVTVRVRSSVITGNRVGIAVSNGGKIISHGDNVNAGNTAGQGAFTQTLAPQ